MNPLVALLTIVFVMAIPIFFLTLCLFQDKIEAWQFNRYVHKEIIPYLKKKRIGENKCSEK